MKHLIITLGALAFAGTLAIAEDKPPGPPPGGPGGRERPSPEQAFKMLDANTDSTVSLEEFKAGPRAQRDPARAAYARAN